MNHALFVIDDAVQAMLGDKAAVEQAKLSVEFTKVTSPLDGLAGLATAQTELTSSRR